MMSKAPIVVMPWLPQLIPPSLEVSSRPFTPWLFQFHATALLSLRFTGPRIMKYDCPPVRLTPEIPLIVTKPQQPPKGWLLIKLSKAAFATCTPGRPALSVQILASKVKGAFTCATAISIESTMKLPLPPRVNRFAWLRLVPKGGPDPFIDQPMPLV